MPDYVIYDETTHAILWSARCSQRVAAKQARDGRAVAPVGSLQAIPDLDSIPAGTRAFVNGVNHGIIDDGSLEITSDAPGTYRVRLDPPFPWRPYETDVVVT